MATHRDGRGEPVKTEIDRDVQCMPDGFGSHGKGSNKKNLTTGKVTGGERGR
jgi:hypothetical protein